MISKIVKINAFLQESDISYFKKHFLNEDFRSRVKHPVIFVETFYVFFVLFSEVGLGLKVNTIFVI